MREPTGKKDVFGKEICVGDKVRHRQYPSDVWIVKKSPYQSEHVYLDIESQGRIFPLSNPKDFEVIE